MSAVRYAYGYRGGPDLTTVDRPVRADVLARIVAAGWRVTVWLSDGRRMVL